MADDSPRRSLYNSDKADSPRRSFFSDTDSPRRSLFSSSKSKAESPKRLLYNNAKDTPRPQLMLRVIFVFSIFCLTSLIFLINTDDESVVDHHQDNTVSHSNNFRWSKADEEKYFLDDFDDVASDDGPKQVNSTVVADCALNQATKELLKLIKREKAHMVLHQGDLDYTGRADDWEKQITSILGKNFPYFFTKGNYEDKPLKSKDGKKNFNKADRKAVWHGYTDIRKRRFAKLGDQLVCPMSDPATQSIACSYRGIGFVLSELTVNSTQLEYDTSFIQKSLKKLDEVNEAASHGDRSIKLWKFCSWHAPHSDIQVGFRTGPEFMRSRQLTEAYNICRRSGAIIITGHEHYYIRSHTIFDFNRPISYKKINVQKPIIKRQPTKTKTQEDKAISRELLLVGGGSTFTVISGLGGHSVSVPSKEAFNSQPYLSRVHPLDLLTDNDPGGKVFFGNFTGKTITSGGVLQKPRGANGYPFGALFCNLQVTGSMGSCYFKTIDDVVVDRFYVQLK